MGTARYSSTGAGTKTAALVSGGEAPGAGALALTEEWNDPGTITKTLTT